MKSLITGLLSTSLLLSSAVMAENHVVNAQVTAFKPLVIKIAPGDTVSWENMNGHMVQTLDEYLPEGAKPFISEMGVNYQTEPLTVEGVYLYKCTPHWGAGMGGAIIVGEPSNLAAIGETKPKGATKRLYKKAKKAIKKK